MWPMTSELMESWNGDEMTNYNQHVFGNLLSFVFFKETPKQQTIHQKVLYSFSMVPAIVPTIKNSK